MADMLWILISTFVFALRIPIRRTQEIQIQDFSNNNGYLPLELETIKMIKSYNKILHVVNITEFETSKDLLKSNVLSLEPKSALIGPIYNTLQQSLALLEAKIENLKPHTREKRGLINILGKGLKYIAGTMDSDDEKEIKTKLDELYSNSDRLVTQTNRQVTINKQLYDQIQNITAHIRRQQLAIEEYINKYTEELANRITTLEDEVALMQYTYHINHDILLLRNHIDDIEQVIFSSKLGILSKNILNTEELKLISSIESYQNIKTAVTSYSNSIIIILLIPQFSETRYSRVLIEPMPDSQNKSLLLDTKEIIVDELNNVYEYPVKENLKKNLVPIMDSCIGNIMNSKIATCNKSIKSNEEIKEIRNGIIITKNLKETNIEHNCNQARIRIKRNYLIRFKNCNVIINNKTYENYERTIYDKVVLPNFIIKTKEKKVIQELKLEDLYLENISNREIIEKLKHKNHKYTIVTAGTNSILILFVILLIIIKIHKKCTTMRKSENKFDLTIISSEPQSNGGGVIRRNSQPKEII